MILVTGATGQLGFELKKILGDKAIYLDRTQLDLSKPQELREKLANYKITALINAGAYTQVDMAEKESDLAQTINAEAPGFLAQHAKEKKFHLVHLSTDYVFDGANSRPYVESDPKNPQSVYGKSKSIGEENILKENSEALIIRTSWVYSSHGKNFIKTILKAGAERDELKVVFDQVGTLTSAQELASTINLALSKRVSGIYHYSGEGVSSWYDVAVFLKQKAKFKAAVLPIRSAEYPTPAKRPSFSVLDKYKIKSDLGLKIPHWTESLERFLGE